MKKFPVPNPKEIPSNLSAELLKLTEYCLTEPHNSNEQIYNDIDEIVLDIYSFTESEKEKLREIF